MKRYKAPKCQAPDIYIPERQCGIEMKILGERHPLWKPGTFVFLCPKCEAIRAIDEATMSRYMERA